MESREGEKNNENLESPWMTTEQVAEYLSVSVGTVRNWVSERRIPFSRRGRVVRFHKERIDAWLSAGSCKGRLGTRFMHSKVEKSVE